MVHRIDKVLQINSEVIMQYVMCQLTSAANDIRFIFTKYTTELRDCTLFKQQT